MASPSEEDLSCPICQEVFKKPVLLSCSHSFCELCLKSWWREKPTLQCPVCKRRSSRSEPPSNLVLRNLCEAYLQQREQRAPEEHVCPLHSERLRLFCLFDQQPVCVVCRDSKAHEGHRLRPIVEAAQDFREELDRSLLLLKEQLQKSKRKTSEKSEKNLFDTAARIKDQAQDTQRQICDEFKKLHQFLKEEEEARLKALKEEEEQKFQRMKDKMAAVSCQEIETLSETIRATEEQLRVTDVTFLLQYKAAVERVQRCPLQEEPQLGPGTLIDQAKHLGNLGFNIWSNMKTLVNYSPIVLDPSNEVLSDNLTNFTLKDKVKKNWISVVGSEGFSSGSHSWIVEVGDSDKWIVGVSTQNISLGFSSDDDDSDDDSEASDEDKAKADDDDENDDDDDEDDGLWSIGFSFGKYRAADGEEDDIHLKLESSPRRIRVCLDCDKHEVSFYDVDTNALIHSMTQISPRKLFLFLFINTKCIIRIPSQQLVQGKELMN